ncbi:MULTISPECIES: hypothetical protein [unclassified Agarivorans]|uniref:hypothetical protein n=1 Tax=unclassified Agarivorans TaxID=2636026 RepID=UPI0026E23E24|nr:MULTISPECIES: hypothetical protein [unclassified Agarivorans]MDO6683895.1 hypothetical protein [Agarivorans sp. 3_MG-2023]MDO6714372.1 hypothetical protein [Agarivorans sp. 2_MG-2023]
MRTFENTDPYKLDEDKRVIFRYSQPTFNNKNTDYYYLLLDDEYFIWATKGYFPPLNGKPEKWVGGSFIEFPKSGLSWFINAIEQKFMKTEAEGGLKKEELTYSEVINDEKLVASRWFGTPGYGLANASRDRYGSSTFKKQQEFCFTDEMLFDKGLLDNLKIIAKKIDSGEL